MHFQFPDATLMIFCKAPIPGQVKTRLTPALTPQQAAHVHIELTHRTIKTAISSQLCPIQLWCSPSIEHDFFKTAAKNHPISLHQQSAGDLGEKMHHAFSTAFKNYKYAIIIGCDCPSLTTDDLQQSLHALYSKNDIVLAPAEDGGYVLIGLNKPHAELFKNMPWGTTKVLNKTRNRIVAAKLNCYELNQHWDVDTIEDLNRLRLMGF